MKTVAECLERGRAHLLLLVGDVLRLARFAHAVALHGLGEDHGRLALVIDRRVIGRVHLVRVVATAVPGRQMSSSDQLATISLQLRILAEELLAHKGTVTRLEGLVFTIHAFVHAFAQQAEAGRAPATDPVAAPDEFEHIPAGAAERGFQFLDDFAVAAHRSVEALQVAVDHEY